MAIIYKSSTSGNWNATSSWVGGVVPTSADDVIFDASSAGVILNVASLVKSLDMTGFTDMFTQSANLTISGSTNSVGQTYDVAPSVIVDGGYAWTTGFLEKFLSGSNKSFKWLDTTPRFQFEMGGGIIKLFSNIYPFAGGRLSITSGTTIDCGTFSIVVKTSYTGNPVTTLRSGNIITFNTYHEENIIFDATNETLYPSMTVRNCGVKLISGTLSSGYHHGAFGAFTAFDFSNNSATGTCSFIQTGGDLDRFGISLMMATTTLPGAFVFDYTSQVENFYLNSSIALTVQTANIIAQSPLNIKYLLHLNPNVALEEAFGNVPRTTIYQILGTGGLSASYYLPQSMRTLVYASDRAQYPAAKRSVYWQAIPTLAFTSDATHKIGKFHAIGLSSDADTGFDSYSAASGTDRIVGTFSSLTASVPATIQLGNPAFSMRYDYKDLVFTGNTLYAIDGNLANTTGATTSYPSGGGGGGGEKAFTFVN